MRVLLTGGYGCIGAWALRELLGRSGTSSDNGASGYASGGPKTAAELA